MPDHADQQNVRIAIIGAGAVSDYHHVPGIRIDPRATLVAACDTSESLLEERKAQWSIDKLTTDYQEICDDPEIDAVIIATPNFTHCPIAVAAAEAGKHVMCEKPLGLDAAEVQQMLDAAETAGVVHMAAFTYRFAPAMRYLKQLASTGQLGELRHFRSQRFLDLPETSWGWRQYKHLAGAGDLFDMTIHRIDFAIDLMGPINRVCGAVAQYAARQQTDDGQPCPASEVDDWSALIGVFESGSVGVWEGTTLARGYGLGGFGHEWAEINGSEASAVYRLHEPNTLLLGRTGQDLEPVDVPSDLLSPPGSPRNPSEGEPATVFRYDLVWEFVSAIVDQRPAVPSFKDGHQAQLVADAVLESHDSGRWIDVSSKAD
jgi:predicted dehydrogenase